MLYRYADGTPAILCNQFGNGTAYLTGVNLGLSYSGRNLVGDDFKSDDRSNKNTMPKNFVLGLCYGLGIAKNLCTAADVKVSVTETENECMLILINSASEDKVGAIRLEKAYGSVETVYGNGFAQLKGTDVQFSLKADESTVFYLRKE